MTDEMFWDSLHSMPDIEAEHELRIRRDAVILENNMLQQEMRTASEREAQRIGVVVSRNNLLLTKIRSEIAVVAERKTRCSWRKAVLANFGEDGYEKCRIWMEQERLSLGWLGGQ